MEYPMLKWIGKLLNLPKIENVQIQRFLDGEINTLTSADIDPQGASLYNNYVKAMEFKATGDIDQAIIFLEQSCNPPSIYKGHYRELFKMWRQKNKEDIKEKSYEEILHRVTTMIRYDDEMICLMLKHWSKVQERKLPPNYFDKDRNLKISDVKAFLKAAQELNRLDLVVRAKELIVNFQNLKSR